MLVREMKKTLGDTKKTFQSNAVRFIGYQIAYATWGLLLQVLLLTATLTLIYVILVFGERYNLPPPYDAFKQIAYDGKAFTKCIIPFIASAF